MGDGEVEEQDGKNMPWGVFNPYFSFLEEKDTNNFYADCKLCSSVKAKKVSCAYSSASNLRTHLKRIHKWSDEKLKDVTVKSCGPSGVNKRKSVHETESSTKRVAGAGGDQGQGILFADPPTQKRLDKTIDKLIFCNRLPHRIVDSQDFRDLAYFGCKDQSKLKVPCRQTLRKRMTERFELMSTNLKKELHQVQYGATFADGWSKYRRGFLGMSVTWLNPETMERSFAGLALVRMKGSHTHDRLAKKMLNVLKANRLDKPGKTTKMTTDSAANFLKAFKVFGSLDLQPANSESEASEAEEAGGDEDELDSDFDEGLDNSDDLVLLDLNEMLTSAEVDGAELPPHQRCGSHVTNRIATEDSKCALKANANYRKLHDSTETKLRKYWRLQNKSNLVSEIFKESFGVMLVIPGKTRWNSNFDAKRQIVKLIEKDDDTFHKAIEAAGLPKLLSSEVKFLTEFVHAMEPVAKCLDILQRDKDMYIGYLPPTIVALEKQLQKRRMRNGKNLTYCDILARTLSEAVCKPNRFGNYRHDLDLSMAATLIPCFKLDWVDDEAERQHCYCLTCLT